MSLLSNLGCPCTPLQIRTASTMSQRRYRIDINFIIWGTQVWCVTTGSIFCSFTSPTTVIFVRESWLSSGHFWRHMWGLEGFTLIYSRSTVKTHLQMRKTSALFKEVLFRLCKPVGSLKNVLRGVLHSVTAWEHNELLLPAHAWDVIPLTLLLLWGNWRFASLHGRRLIVMGGVCLCVHVPSPLRTVAAGTAARLCEDLPVDRAWTRPPGTMAFFLFLLLFKAKALKRLLDSISLSPFRRKCK